MRLNELAISTFTLLALGAAPAFSGGLAEPVVMSDTEVSSPAPSFNWSGGYGGLSYNTFEQAGVGTSPIECPQTLQKRTIAVAPCPGDETESFPILDEFDTVGAFIGGRHQFGSGVVIGMEANYIDGDDPITQVEGQVGYALNRLLPYAGVGPDHYSAGADFAVTDRVMVGLRGWQSHDGDDTGFALRAGFMF